MTRVLAALLVIAGFWPAPARAEPEAEPDWLELARRLDSPRKKERLAAVEAAAGMGRERAAAYLRPILAGDEDREVRLAAVKALRSIPGEDAATLLGEGLADEDLRVRLAAVEALRRRPEASAELWKALPPLDGWVRLASLRPGASVLLRHPSEKTPAGDPLPVVALREFGKGKVMIVGTESSWRWKLAGGGDWRLASFYSRFWNRAVEYLTGSLDLKKVKFSPLPDRMPPREPAVAALRTFDEHFRPLPGSETDLRVLWTPPGAKAPRSVAFFEREPGLFQVELTDLAEGRHRLRAVARRRGQPWGEDETEFLWQKVKGDAPLDRKRLKAVAERTGGRYADLDRLEPSALLEGLAPPKRERLASSRRALWGSPAWLWTLCALLFAEWFLRRRGGWL